MPDHPQIPTATFHPMLRLWCRIQSRIATGERGQTTAEYALVVLGAATVAMLLIAWATDTGKVATLLNKVVTSVSDRIA
ncbi:MAG: hypothetical protein DHS20C19_23120 [Acidimicrobiales bacterium]|nr:MAG: hypothetical protein DHS20C19_23120 [Acidimicrobiales bacterium]